MTQYLKKKLWLSCTCCKGYSDDYFINPFSTNVPLLYPPENIRKPPVF